MSHFYENLHNLPVLGWLLVALGCRWCYKNGLGKCGSAPVLQRQKEILNKALQTATKPRKIFTPNIENKYLHMSTSQYNQ